MWQIDPRHLRERGRTGEGSAFTAMVDSAIRGAALRFGIPQADIHTNLRTNLGDGGVDTQVDESVPGGAREPFGWLEQRSVWQYKATDFSVAVAAMAKEVRKSHAKKLIEQDYAYRLCVCDEVPAEDVSEALKTLRKLVSGINPNAPEPRILIASDVAGWMQSFPALVVRFFQPGLATALDIGSWGPNAIGNTAEFVPVPDWNQTATRLRGFLHLDVDVPTVVFPIQGEAGVGKTRLVYEVLAALPGASEVVLYTADEHHALAIATVLASNQDLNAILVADECNVGTREKLRTLLDGHRHRSRVIAIDISGQTAGTMQPEELIRRIPAQTLEEILAKNFPRVPAERRRAYSDYSGGFVRLAADMCNHDALIADKGHVGPVTQLVADYLARRLSPEDLIIVEAIALVDRVGFSGEVAGELQALCGYLGLDPARVLQTAARIHNVPGFIATAGRFLYITPEIVAQVAFEGAWARWASINQDFASEFPASIREGFLRRVQRSAPEEVRGAVGASFRRWFNELGPNDLASVDAVDRLVGLVETQPTTYLPSLRALVERCSSEQLFEIKGSSLGGRWGPRRELVWLVERLAAFPEQFDDCELILRRFAIAESEPTIGNNATAVWIQLFGISLSGTAIPFNDRLERLKDLLDSDDGCNSDLAFKGLEQSLSQHNTRMLGPAVVGGRIPPPEWRPTSNREYWSAFDDALNVMFNLIEKGKAHSDRALGFLIRHLRQLLYHGRLTSLEAVLRPNKLSEDQLLATRGHIEEFLHFDCSNKNGKPAIKESYVEEVRTWLDSLAPTNLHERVVAVTGVQPFHRSIVRAEESWKRELASVAAELYGDRNAFEQEIPWLMSGNALSAGLLGKELGILDRDVCLAGYLVRESLTRKSTMLARGYIDGVLQHENALFTINHLIDGAEAEDPTVAFDLATAGGERVGAVERILRLVDEGRLSSRYLQAFTYNPPLLEASIVGILQRLLDAAASGDQEAFSIALDFAGSRIVHNGLSQDELKSLTPIALKLLQTSLNSSNSLQTYWWAELLQKIAPFAPGEITTLAVAVLFSDNISLRHDAEQAVAALARDYPEPFLQALGMFLGEKDLRWRFGIGEHRAIIQALPEDALIAWLKTQDIEVVRYIARHTPSPYLDAQDQPRVPKVTEFLLTHYEDDDPLFHEFIAGVHSMQMYTGDIAALHEGEARIARRFLNHPLHRVREWATYEEASALAESARWRQIDEERNLRSG